MSPKFLLHVLVMLTMAGCSHMPVTSMVKLARVDFETSDPAQLRAAIKLPRTLRPQPNGVALRIAVQVGRAPEEARDFMLRELSEPAELTREAGAGSHIFAYRIDDSDLARLKAFRSELIDRKSSRPEGLDLYLGTAASMQGGRTGGRSGLLHDLSANSGDERLRGARPRRRSALDCPGPRHGRRDPALRVLAELQPHPVIGRDYAGRQALAQHLVVEIGMHVGDDGALRLEALDP